MDIKKIALDSLRKKYPFLLGKSFFKADSWLSLEVLAVLAIIAALNLAALTLVADYFYKVAYAAPITHQFIESRIDQQEYYAWHGQFEDTQLNHEFRQPSDELPQFDQIYSQRGRTVIAMKPYQHYPSTQVTLTLDDSHNSVIRPICQIKHNETFHLMPYMCKINYYEKQ